jgi:hypothetical protein
VLGWHLARNHPLLDRLLVEFELGSTLLFSQAGVGAAVGDGRAAEVLRVCEVARLRRWLTRAAAGLDRRHPGLGSHRATTLVLMRPWQISEIASFDPFLTRHGVPTIPVLANRSVG